ncbi:hypothetical protein HAX54_008310 [Datura stramonium]|uniref:Uncharacterized protein n=1 Tax=Datura stramonium TaxID=4076 RepID=A0ABS8TD80_DATST|nr:hypothetical protein [Datura stramonium]
MIEKAMQPAKDKLKGLYAKPEVPKSPLDDWWAGFDSSSEIVSDEEIYHSWPPPHHMLTVREVDPSWKPGRVDTTFYHELKTLPDKWVVPGLGKLLELPPSTSMSSTSKTSSWHFDEATYSWIPRPNH